MELIFWGYWLKREGFFKGKIKKVRFLSSFEDIEPSSFSFLLLSYHMAEESLCLRLKPSEYPLGFLLELEDIEPVPAVEGRTSLEPAGSSFTPEGYMQAVERIKRYIEEGTIYQLNLTCRFDFHLDGSPKDLFFKYFLSQPVPYAFFLDLEDFFVMSGSMELFLKKEKKLLTSQPIKGTSKSKKELEESHKDKAENLMITDMVRNDLSRVCLPGSVKVKELFKIEEYKTLFQMHSTVEGITEASLKQILFHTFPPASVVGAPKRKAVELIDLLEPHSRNYYCGCAGFILGEDFTLSVLIRTAIGRAKELSYYAGAGIVWDSEPQREWEEVLLKCRAFEVLTNSG